MLTAVLALSALTLTAQGKKYGIALNESFENGLPETWTQEHVNGNRSWTVESGTAGYPDGAAAGDKRVALRNGTSQTIGYATRLITPVMNLDTILEPILTFEYASDKWAGDFDTLRIYYRTSADMQWIEYTDHSSDRYRSGWTKDTVRLNAPNATYQLAFEGRDNMGRGIVLDNIQVRSTPSCETPELLPVINLQNNTATLTWRANFDATKFRLKVSSTVLSTEDLNSEDVIADIVDEVVEARVYQLDNLLSGKTYYAYIQSLCPNETSEWSSQYSFTTTNLMDIPYEQYFNLKEAPGYIYGATAIDWYTQDNDENYISPFINTNTPEKDLYQYSRSNTRSLFFADNNSITGTLDPGDWCYVALPELKPEYNIKEIQASFWGMCTRDNVDHGRLIVGIMTDPADKESFVAIDTAIIDKKNIFQEFIVPFDKYEGTGRFIALMSDFEDNNYFILDNLLIENIPPCAKANRLKLGITSPTTFNISWYGTSEGEILISKNQIEPSIIDENTPSILRQNLTSNPATVEGMTPWSTGYIYVRNKCDDVYGAWSNPVFIRMPEMIQTLPDTITFEINPSIPSTFYLPALDDNGTNTNNQLPRGIMALIENSTAYPYLYERGSTNHTINAASKYSLCLYPPQEGSMVCAIMPYVEDIRNVRISMYSKWMYTYSTTAHYEVGVMSDAKDISTFTPVDTIWVDNAWKQFKVSFDKYHGNGHFIALRARNEGPVYSDNSSFATSNINLIDNLIFEAIPDCREPDNVNVSFDNDKVTLSWDALGMNKWRVRLWKGEIKEETLEDDSYSNYIKDEIVSDNPSVTFEIEPNEVQYYYSVAAICGEERSLWKLPSQFTTVCLDGQPLPYKMNFDGYKQGINKKELPVPCWTTKVISVSHPSESQPSYYPSLSTNQKYGNSGQSLHLKHGTDYYTDIKDYVVLPLMAEEDLSKLQVKMMMMCSPMNNSNPRLNIGVVNDPDDISTFDSITSISTNVKTWAEYIAPLTNFKPGKGQYIALKMATNAGNFDFYIDDVVIEEIPKCAKVQNLKCVSSTKDQAVLSWIAGGNETNWDVVITDAEVTGEILDAAMTGGETLPENVVKTYNTGDNPFTATGLVYNSTYRFYVRANCGNDNGTGEWNMSAEPFNTECATVKPGDLTFNDFKSDLATNCWSEFGNLNASGGQVTSNIPARTNHTTGIPAYEGNGDYLLKFYGAAVQRPYAIAPLLDIEHVKEIEVSFMGSGGVTYAEKPWNYTSQIRVGVITQTEKGNFDYTSFEEIAVLDGYVDYQPYTVSFDQYEMDYNENVGKHIIFMLPEGGANPKSFNIDNIRFDYIAANPAPVDLKAEEITSNSAKITWRSRKEGQTFEVKYAIRQLTQEELDGTVAVTNLTVGTAMSDKDTAVISALDPASRYYAYVRAADTDGNKSGWSAPIRFKSDCPVAYALPYVQTFDPDIDRFVNTIPTGSYYTADCWKSFYAGQTTEKASVNYPYIKEKKGVDGTNCLEIYSADATKPSYAVMPEIESDLSNITLEFEALANTTNVQRSIIVGISRDVSDNDLLVSTFMAVDTIILKNAEEFNKFFIPFRKYDVSGKGNIVFTTAYDLNLNSSGSKSTGGYYLDNVKVYETPSCPRPEYLEVAGYSENYIKLQFEEMGGASKWQVKYIEKGDGSKTAPVLEYDSVTPVITGLSPKTTYELYVRAYCSETDQSEWIGPITQTTMALPVTEYPYTMNFEDDEADEFENWMLVQDFSTDKWYRGAGYNYPEGEASKQLYISSDNGASATYDKEGDSKSYSWAYRRVTLEPGQYKFSFDWACDGYSSNNFLHAGLLPIDARFDSKSDKVIQGNGIIDNLDYYSIAKSASSQKLDQYISLDYTIDGYWRLYNGDSTWTHNNVDVIITEELAGDYNLIFFWRKTGKTTSENYMATPSAVVDNIQVVFNDCMVPTIRFSEILNDNATIKLGTIGGAEHSAYDIFVTANDSVLAAEEIKKEEKLFEKTEHSDNVCTITGLSSSTVYYVFVRSLCGEDKYSDWSRIEFETACDPIAIPHTFGFEEAEGLHDGASKTYQVPDCFLQGPAPVTSSAFFPYAVKNASNKVISRNPSDDDQYALHFTRNNNNTTALAKYIVFPLMDADLNELRVRFWMRCGYELNSGKISAYKGDNYDPTLIVGTMTDPNDASTFRPLKEVRYSLNISGNSTPASSDPTGNRWWQEFSVPLNGAIGKYIAFKSDSSEAKYKFVWIDDVTVEYATACEAPYDVEVAKLTPESAELAFRHIDGNKWAIAISTQTDMSDTLRVDTVTNSTAALLKNLNPNTQYTVAVQQICENQKSEWSQSVTFETYAKPRFHEGFNEARSYPRLWMVSTQTAETILSKGDKMQQTSSSLGSRFKRASSHGLPGAHSMISMAYTANSWLVTPQISLENATDVQLTFDLALTSQGVSAPIIDGYKGAADKYFMVVVSDDGGETWKSENIADVWANEGSISAYTATRSLDDVPAHGEKVKIDLSEYAGKVIKIGFYASSQNNEKYYDLHIDNIQVNRFKNENPVISICETYDLETDIISVTSDELSLGENIFEITKVSNKDQSDINYSLTVQVQEMEKTFITDSICAGDVYTKHNFNTTKGGLNKIKVNSANKCDSVVYLDLKLIQPKFTLEKDTICQGQTYTWNGKTLDRSGVYYDTIPTATSRCDSVIQLILEVTPAITYNVDMAVCFGETYLFGDNILDEDGAYTETFLSSEGCDSIVNLNFTVRPDLRQTIYDVLCKGEKYNKHGFTGVVGPGPHVLPLTTKDGLCDSTITLHLTIIESEETYVKDSITVDELPYRYLDLYYDENTSPGTYRDTLYIETETCKSTVIHELIVTLPNAVDIVTASKVVFAPNPVKAGEKVQILASMSDAERNGLTIRVFSSSGNLLQQFCPEGEPIEIGGLNTAGIYMVIITDGLGNMHTGKIIVK